IVLTAEPGGRLSYFLDRGEQEADQDGDDGDHHQQLDQRESQTLMHTTAHTNYSQFGRGTRRVANRAAELAPRTVVGNRARMGTARKELSRNLRRTFAQKPPPAGNPKRSEHFLLAGAGCRFFLVHSRRLHQMFRMDRYLPPSALDFVPAAAPSVSRSLLLRRLRKPVW